MSEVAHEFLMSQYKAYYSQGYKSMLKKYLLLKTRIIY